jgi:hypothetical protein
MATYLKKEVSLMTPERFAEIQVRLRELEKLMDENQEYIRSGLEDLKQKLRKHLGWD